MKHERLIYVAYLMVAVAGVMVVLFLNFAANNAENHERGVQLLGNLRQLETELTREVLQVTSFRLVQYDGLVSLSKELGRLQTEMKQGPWFSRAVFAQSLRDYIRDSGERLHLLERIKSRAAFLRNAHHYLPSAVAALEQRFARQLVSALDRNLVRLFRYTLSSTVDERDALEGQLDQLQSLIPEDESGGEIAHIVRLIEVNIRVTTQQAQALDEFLKIPVGAHLEGIEGLDEAGFAVQSARVRRLSLALVFVAAFLFVGLGYAISRLRRAQRRSAQAWNQLNDAIESLSESFALFDREGGLQRWNHNYERDYAAVSSLLRRGLSYTDLARAMVEQGQFAASTGSDEETLQALLSNHREAKERYVQSLKNGRFLLTTTNFTSDGGRAVVGVDITWQKRVEGELRKLSQAVEQSPVIVVVTDLDGSIEYVNPKFEQVTGYSAAEAIGQNPRILKSNEGDPAVHDALWESMCRGETWQGEFHNRRKDGSLYWESAVISPIRGEDGKITHYIAVKEDVTERKQVEEQLRLAATVFEKTREGLVVTDSENRIKAVNPAFCEITGYSMDEAVGKDPKILSSGRQSPEFYARMWSALDREGYWEGEIWNRRKSGEVYAEWLSLTAIRDREGKVVEHVAVFSDITQRLQDEEHIRHQANYDSLTELPNRSLFLDRLGSAVLEAQRQEKCVAILFVDLDRFKPVNDSLGHQAGDEILRQVARRLTDLVRGNDTVARLSGDEFVLILNGLAERKGAASMAERVNQALAEAFEVNGQEVFIGSSVGISVYPQDAEDTSTLLRNADMAMYRAKQAGRGTYRFFTAEMDAYIADRLALERDMRKGLDHREFLLHYQPIVDPCGLELRGLEVLVRWQHPQQGLLLPGSFITLAEETGMIGKLGEWVLRRACEQGRHWHEAGFRDFSLSVNLSSRQVRGGLSRARVEDILRETGFPAKRLTLEITESLLLEENREVVAWLNSIKALGITLALDDFGTGYSSLSYLKRFPIDVLKIDRVFISGIMDDSDDQSLTEAILAMARSLNMKVVAEGVETLEQLEFLIAHGCDAVQGFYVSRPFAAEDLTAYLDATERKFNPS